MPYAVINQTPGDLDIFEQVNAIVPQEPEGFLASIHGMSDQGLTVVSLWRSQEDADRFYVEHLGPALSKVVGDPVPPPITFIAVADAELRLPSS